MVGSGEQRATEQFASSVDLWLDVRYPDDAVVHDLVTAIETRAAELADASGCSARLREESYSATAHFDSALRKRIETLLPQAPVLPTGAGHDAGVLAPHVPTAMLFVRNPTGISHSPEEHAEDADVEAGMRALATVLADLTTTNELDRHSRE